MDNYYVHNYGQLERHQFKPIQSVDDSTLNQPAIYRECAETCTWAFPLLSVVQMCAISCFHCLLLLSYNTVPMVFIVVNLFPHEVSHQKLYFFIQKIISCSQFNCSTYLLFETDVISQMKPVHCGLTFIHPTNEWTCAVSLFSMRISMWESWVISNNLLVFVSSRQTI